MNEVVRRWLLRLGRFGRLPGDGGIVVGRLTDDELAEFDAEMAKLEREQREIAARLRLLARQADPRGWRDD